MKASKSGVSFGASLPANTYYARRDRAGFFPHRGECRRTPGPCWAVWRAGTCFARLAAGGAMTEPVKRRLAVILAFDMVGYSRLMEEDEEGTHQRMMDVTHAVVQPLLAQHEGRLVKKTGDGGLVEFASVVEAARWALSMQRKMALRNAPEDTSRRIEFRIGISLGDIIIEPDDIYGEGVNIAARLQ